MSLSTDRRDTGRDSGAPEEREGVRQNLCREPGVKVPGLPGVGTSLYPGLRNSYPRSSDQTSTKASNSVSVCSWSAKTATCGLQAVREGSSPLKGNGSDDDSEKEFALRKRTTCDAGARRDAAVGADGNHVSVAAVSADLKLRPIKGASYGEPSGEQAFAS